MAVSNLVTTGGLAASDLITEPQWTLLASNTTSSNTSSITFSSISQNYRVLRIMSPYVTLNGNARLAITFNSNGNQIYNQFGYAEYSNTIDGFRETATSMYINRYTPGNSYVFDCIVPNYTSSTDYKLVEIDTVYSFSSFYHEKSKTIFGSNSAITSVTIQTIGAVTMNPAPNGYTGQGIFIYGAK